MGKKIWPDMTDRVDELRGLTMMTKQEMDEFDFLVALLEKCKDKGGDLHWEGDWYPSQLINLNYFEEYAKELAQDLGCISGNEEWPFNCIDWKKAAEILSQDHAQITYGKETYLAR